MTNKVYLFVLFITGVIVWFTICLYKIYYEGHSQISQVKYNLEKENIDLIYFGDSVLFSIDTDDDLLGMKEFGKPIWKVPDILRELTSWSLLDISHGNFSPVIYKEYANLIVQQPKKPKVVVIPINMRNFSSEWFYHPMYQFDVYKSQIGALTGKSFFENFSSYFKGRFLLESRIKQWLKRDIGYNLINLNHDDLRTFISLENNSTKREMILFRYHYLYSLTSNHKYFANLKNTIDSLRSSGINVLTYITPINIEEGTRLLGKEFSDIVNNNVNIIENFLALKKIPFINLLMKVKNENFMDKHVVCEHVDYVGKRFIALEIQKKITELKWIK